MSSIVDSTVNNARGGVVIVNKQQNVAYQEVRTGTERLREKVVVYVEGK